MDTVTVRWLFFVPTSPFVVDERSRGLLMEWSFLVGCSLYYDCWVQDINTPPLEEGISQSALRVTVTCLLLPHNPLKTKDARPRLHFLPAVNNLPRNLKAKGAKKILWKKVVIALSKRLTRQQVRSKIMHITRISSDFTNSGSRYSRLLQGNLDYNRSKWNCFLFERDVELISLRTEGEPNSNNIDYMKNIYNCTTGPVSTTKDWMLVWIIIC